MILNQERQYFFLIRFISTSPVNPFGTCDISLDFKFDTELQLFQKISILGHHGPKIVKIPPDSEKVWSIFLDMVIWCIQYHIINFYLSEIQIVTEKSCKMISTHYPLIPSPYHSAKVARHEVEPRANEHVTMANGLFFSLKPRNHYT